MKKLIRVALVVLIVFVIMWAEYRYIMINIKPCRGENNALYLEIFGQVDEYYLDDTAN